MHKRVPSPRQRPERIDLRQAMQNSDFTTVAQHTHEPDNQCIELPNCLPALARQLVDNGADMLCGHAPHQIRGIDIYKDKPLLYSPGNFCCMDNGMKLMPAARYESRERQSSIGRVVIDS